jgi:hypothetical protein
VSLAILSARGFSRASPHAPKTAGSAPSRAGERRRYPPRHLRLDRRGRLAVLPALRRGCGQPLRRRRDRRLGQSPNQALHALSRADRVAALTLAFAQRDLDALVRAAASIATSPGAPFTSSTPTGAHVEWATRPTKIHTNSSDFLKFRRLRCPVAAVVAEEASTMDSYS